uniref:FA complementation group D2 n=1 Tax=Scleropages formosus TaxID=113540 RepID=A0A8C9SCI8_SCLFO
MLRKKRRSSVDEESKKSRSTGRAAKSTVQDEAVRRNVFTQVLREAGIALRQSNTPNEIDVDQAVFQKRVHQLLRKSPQYPNIIQEFVSGLESHIEDQENFKNCLLPCVPRSSDGDSSSVCSYQESLIRLLLGVEILQVCTNFCPLDMGENGVNIPRIIVNQLKWLDRIMDSKDLAGKLMELVSVAPVELQRDIIVSLPEILEDSQHNDVAQELNSLLQQNTQLTVPVLDALSSLNLNPALLAEVRSGVMATLTAVSLEDLPVIVKFILHTVSASEANEVVSDLRKKLELEFCVSPALTQASQHSDNQGCVGLVLDTIKSAVRFQKTISEAWLKAIENVVETEDHKVTDLLVLFILHTVNANHSRRGAERVLRIKVRGGQIRETLLQRTFRGYADVMRNYFPSILSLAQGLLRSPDPCVVPFGAHMYKHAFSTFDSYCQQEVVSSLVTHICSGLGGEVDAALELLCELVVQRPDEMALYAVFVKGILDYMENLTPQQIRRLFCVLSSLAFGKEQQGSHIQDDMHIVIRKQLSSTVSKYKRIGIIGAVMVVGRMSSCSISASQAGTLKDKERQRQVMALLELVKSCSEGSPEAAALYYDELSNLLQTCTLDLLVQEWIGKSVLEDFQEDFVIDLTPDISGNFPFPAAAMYNLDEDESQGGIAINLLPLLADAFCYKGERVSPLCLASFFRLLRLCEENQHKGDLEEIDLQLSCCPIMLTDLDVVEKVESLSKPEREFLCSLLFYTINWFREVVNAFCHQKDPEMKMKVVTRLQNITYLQTVLERALAATPGFVPPPANFDGDVSERPVVPSVAIPGKKGNKEKAGRKRKTSASKSSSGDGAQLEEGTEADESQQVKEKEFRLGVSLASYRPFFRELDVEVLGVLQCGLLSRSLLDTELHSREREEVQLGPAELVFLLEDMLRKLDFSLAPVKRAPFLKVQSDRSVGFSHLQQKSPQDIAISCVQLLPTLCAHLENCHNHFQALISANQGVVDAPGVDENDHQLMSSVYQLLLQVLHTTFSWTGFCQHEHHSKLKSALAVLAGRLKEGEANLPLEQLVRHSFEYLVNFGSTVPSLSSALSLTQLLIVVSEGRTISKSTTCGSVCADTCLSPCLYLGSIYLERTGDVLRAVEEIVGEGIPELMNAAKDGNSKTFPTLTRQTFLVFFRGTMAILERSVRRIPAAKQDDSNEVQTEKLLTWNLAVRDFHMLVNLVKVNLEMRPFETYGRLFLEAFLKLGMPLLDYSFKKHKEDVQSLLKTFQLSTRQLHHMCGHSKIRQDTGLTNHVPALKKSLEQFVYRVKAMLVLNNCQEAFWLGNLKNRDLKGEEILSQRSRVSDEEGEEQTSELPEEGSDDEVKTHCILS